LTNLKLAPWVPQERLLAHPKMKGFVTEGGLNSIIESTRHGVPMIIVPLFGDQMGNRWRAEQHGIAVGIERKKFKTKKLVASLETILQNQTYKSNAERLSRMMKGKPVKPADLITGWVDFIIEYKELTNLRPASLNLSLLQYLMIDALMIVLLILSMFSYVVCRICYCYYWRCFETRFHDKAD